MALIVYDLALTMLRRIKPLIDIVARHDRNLADQMQRSAQSSFLNIAEGQSARGRNEVAKLTVALCETREARAALAVAMAWGYLTYEQGRSSDAELDRMCAMLWGLTRKRQT
jgi:four helix bundle protein